MDHSGESITALSLCTGIRGLERGIERVVGPIRTLAYVEIEAALVENLVVGIEAGKLAPAPIWSNLKTFPFGAFHGRIFIVLGGYPCQPFSTAGRRKGTEDPRHLWPHIERGIGSARPLCCFFENVLGHLSLGFNQVTESLRAMDYLVEAGIYTAAEVGAPHKRARIFILAIMAAAKDHVRGLYERQWRYRISPIYLPFADKTMANPFSNGAGADPGNYACQSGEAQGAQQWEEWNEIQRQRSGADARDGGADVGDAHGANIAGFGRGKEQTGWPSSTYDGPELDNAINERLQGFAGDDVRASGRTFAYGPTAAPNLWPARPGEPQQAWEFPRLISREAESGMGISVNGYSFREDLLRALGNGVVEQTAELAFRDLLRKHFE